MDFLSILASGPATTTELARRAGVTLSSALQTLQRLEARGEAASAPGLRSARGRRARVWRLAERVRVTGAVFGRRVDVAVEPTPLEKALLRCLCIPQRGFGEAVERWLCAYESLDGSPRLRGTALICVFGSVARGGADVDSDIDILVVTDREAPPGPWGEDYPLRGGAEGLKVVSPLFLSMEEFERNMRLDGNVRRAVREGILVWERGTD